MDHLSTELLGRTRVPEGEQAESRGLLAASWTPLGAAAGILRGTHKRQAALLPGHGPGCGCPLPRGHLRFCGEQPGTGPPGVLVWASPAGYWHLVGWREWR